MTDEHDNNNIHPKSDLEEGVNLFAGKDLLFDEDKALEDIIRGYHPNVTEKELALCKTITWALWDIGAPFYEAIIYAVLETYKKLFTDLQDVENPNCKQNQSGEIFMCFDCSSGNGITISSANAVVSLKDVVATNVAAVKVVGRS